MTMTSSRTDAATFEGQTAGRPTLDHPLATHKTTKLDKMAAKLMRPEGATITDLMAITGWQAHSVRGALAGALKKKGHVIISEKIDGMRRYRIGAAM